VHLVARTEGRREAGVEAADALSSADGGGHSQRPDVPRPRAPLRLDAQLALRKKAPRGVGARGGR